MYAIANKTLLVMCDIYYLNSFYNWMTIIPQLGVKFIAEYLGLMTVRIKSKWYLQAKKT